MKKQLNEIKRLQKIAGLLKEVGDIDLSDTPNFKKKPRTVEEYFSDEDFADFIDWLVSNRSEWLDGNDIEDLIRDDLKNNATLEDMEEYWENYQEYLEDSESEEQED